MPSVPAPDHERVVEYPAVHSDCTVNVILDQSRSADDHAVGDVVIRAALRHLACQMQVIAVELEQVFRERDVAGTHLTFTVCDNGIDGNAVVPDKFVTDRQYVEFLYSACRLSYAPAHQHVEFQSILTACPDQICSAFIHSLNASALEVSSGLISFIQAGVKLTKIWIILTDCYISSRCPVK